MKIEQLAQIAHNYNRALCQAFGDNSQKPWEEAQEWQKNSAVSGVIFHLENPHSTPEQSHEKWMADKVAEGWVYGEVKDAEAKTHPCILPYNELTSEHKAKDYIFKLTVDTLKPFLS